MATDAADRAPLVVRAVQRLEETKSADALVRRLAPVSDALVSSPGRRDLLQGKWLGHAVHPLLTDLPLGFWTSATVLDIVGGRSARPAAQRLVGLGLAFAVPTAVTGVAEWGSTDTAERRVGAVHAMLNSSALMLFTASYVARRRSQHSRGVMLALAGGVFATAGGYLGGHLIEVRKVSSRHPAFEPESETQSAEPDLGSEEPGPHFQPVSAGLGGI